MLQYRKSFKSDSTLKTSARALTKLFRSVRSEYLLQNNPLQPYYTRCLTFIAYIQQSLHLKNVRQKTPEMYIGGVCRNIYICVKGDDIFTPYAATKLKSFKIITVIIPFPAQALYSSCLSKYHWFFVDGCG